jgi:hypothetical protein
LWWKSSLLTVRGSSAVLHTRARLSEHLRSRSLLSAFYCTAFSVYEIMYRLRKYNWVPFVSKITHRDLSLGALGTKSWLINSLPRSRWIDLSFYRVIIAFCCLRFPSQWVGPKVFVAPILSFQNIYVKSSLLAVILNCNVLKITLDAIRWNSVTYINYSDWNFGSSFAHRVIMVIYTVLRGSRFAAQSWMLTTTADFSLFPQVEDSPKLTKMTKTGQWKMTRNSPKLVTGTDVHLKIQQLAPSIQDFWKLRSRRVGKRLHILVQLIN